jgi:hypothetical protein
MKKSRIDAPRQIRVKRIIEAARVYPDLIGVYREKVLPQKTRTLRLLGRKNPAKIIHTLLGYEVQASYKRIQCPDLVTARYLRLFSELGCHSIKLPYDPTVTEVLIPGFEATVDRIKEKIQELFPRDLSAQLYATQRVYAFVRRGLASS